MSYHKYPPLALNSSLGGAGNVVDKIDALGADGAFEVTGANLIPRSSNATGLQIHTGLNFGITGIQVISDIGEFVNIYSDVNCTNHLATMVLTPDETVPLAVDAGTEIYLRAVKDIDIDQPGSYLAMNFLG